MPEIHIRKTDGDTFEVTVEDVSTTTHAVTLSQEYYQKLTSGKVSEETLIQASFEFLLQRESNSSILSRFELPVIGRYFPEYEKTMGERL